ncbi:hypothetical protein PENSPDRAFT_695146 [Peniophora sp. CONT]|nr:hypothetical protein PENSPDRAFT_695146 [Peniophora sp. CONT]
MDRAPSAPTGTPPNPAAKSLSKLKFSKKSAVPAGATPTLGQPSVTASHPPESPAASSSPLPPPPPHLPAKPIKPLPLDFPPKLAVRWADNTALVAVNTDYAPGDPRDHIRDTTYTSEDGLWGWSEISRLPQPFNASAPHLACMQIPPADDPEVAQRVEFREALPYNVDYSLTVNGRMQSNIFRTGESLHQMLEQRKTALVDNMGFALGMFEDAFRAGAPDKSSITYRVACEIKPPHAAVALMRHSWAMLHWASIPSFADFMTCFRVHQRAAHIVSAYIDFIVAFLPADVSKELRTRLERNVKTDRRGVILSGEDMEIYLRFYARLGIPVYALVSLDEYHVPEEIFRKPDAPRCSVVPSIKYSEYPILVIKRYITNIP